MPREIIQPRLHGTSDNPAPAVSVGWHRNGTAQIGTVKDGELGLDGHFVDLDRDGINRLIRLLRKARDVAYGADA